MPQRSDEEWLKLFDQTSVLYAGDETRHDRAAACGMFAQMIRAELIAGIEGWINERSRYRSFVNPAEAAGMRILQAEIDEVFKP